MGRSLKLLSFLLFGLLLFQTTGLTAENVEKILFTQVTPAGETLYIANADGSGLHSVASDRSIAVFPGKRHLLFLTGKKLFEYDFHLNQTKFIAKFTEPSIQVSIMPEGPDQALIIAFSEYDYNYYVLDFGDDNIRPVSKPSNFHPGSSRKYTVPSPDNQAYAAVSGTAWEENFKMSVEVKDKRKWKLPDELTLLPEMLIWSPDSSKLAFYAMPSGASNGFYSLYLLDLTQPGITLRKVQDEVFSTYLYSSHQYKAFKPYWTDDSAGLVFSFLPYGLPSESFIFLYKVEAGEKEVLHNNRSQNFYPQLSANQERLLFLSDREENKFQVFLLSLKGKDITRISPSEGYTAWAEWYRPDN